MNNASTWGHPDLFGEYSGMSLYSEGHYKAALKYFKYGARYADKLSQLSIGLMYENGQGVEKDPVTACAWLALAAGRKFPSFIATRNRVCEALTPAQHDQAVAVLEKLMPEYGDAVAKPRMVRALDMAKTEGTGSRLVRQRHHHRRREAGLRRSGHRRQPGRRLRQQRLLESVALGPEEVLCRPRRQVARHRHGRQHAGRQQAGAQTFRAADQQRGAGLQRRALNAARAMDGPPLAFASGCERHPYTRGTFFNGSRACAVTSLSSC